MTIGQIANGLGSTFAFCCSLAFILSYGLLAPWHKSSIGRFMVIKAVGICLTCLITVALTVNQFTDNVDWLRVAQAGVWVIIGGAFVHHTVLVWRAQGRNKRDASGH